MCHECNALKRKVESLEAANSFLRGLNTRINNRAVILQAENNNLRHLVGVTMLPVRAGYLANWEREQEGGAA